MKLSQLVAYKNELDLLSSVDAAKSMDAELEKITHTVETQNIQLGDLSLVLQQKRQAVQHAVATFESSLQELKQEIKELITETEKPWFQESYRLYEQEMIYETTDYTLNRRPNITPETDKFYRSRILRYNNWTHPAMIIRPGLETYITELVASDPLYLVDEKHDLLAPSMNMFNDQYQQRLRPYAVNERSDQPILEKLPDGQFGLVFAYNFFNYRPFEVIKKYFSEIYQKLRPGGMLVMTFNDCDRAKAVMLVEQHCCCYTPGYLVRELAQSLGYEIVFAWADDGPTTWIEFRKPGQYQSLRGGQALAKVIPK